MWIYQLGASAFRVSSVAFLHEILILAPTPSISTNKRPIPIELPIWLVQDTPLIVYVQAPDEGIKRNFLLVAKKT